MDIVISGRSVEVPEHFREHTTEKLARLGRYDHKIIRLSVELSHEPNPRRAKSCQRVEITGHGRGPAVRAEACTGDFYSALDQALGRLEERLRRAHDRRRVHHGRRQPLSVARATAGAPGGGGGVAVLEEAVPDTAADEAPDAVEELVGIPAMREPVDDAPPGTIARRKEHHAVPMSVDDALSQMELVGHDFFLFSDAETGRPSVVYRRRGYDYGVIALV